SAWFLDQWQRYRLGPLLSSPAVRTMTDFPPDCVQILMNNDGQWLTDARNPPRRESRCGMRLPVSMLAFRPVLVSPQLRAQDTEVTGARISLQPRTVPIERVTIENRRDSPLVAVGLGLSAAAASQPLSTTYFNFGVSDGHEPAGTGSIKPNESRIVDVQVLE